MVPAGRPAAVPAEPMVVAGRLAVAEPALLREPEGRLAAVALSLMAGVVLTTVDLPVGAPFVSVPLTVVTLLGTDLPADDWVLVVVLEATVLFLLTVLLLPMPPLSEVLPANTLSEPVS